jgi:methionyl-tRNA synthetase
MTSDNSISPPSDNAALSPSTPPVASAAITTISYDDFAKLELRVGRVVDCRLHANADKLLVVQIELGNGERRQVCAGIRQWYQPEQLIGKNVVVVANLAPRQLRGEVSQGMLLATTDAATGNVIVISPAGDVAPGSVVK